jgi:hypothetical protein
MIMVEWYYIAITLAFGWFFGEGFLRYIRNENRSK